MKESLNFWADFKSQILRNNLGGPFCKQWMDPVQLLNIEPAGQYIYFQIQVPSELHKTWFKEHLFKELSYFVKRKFEGKTLDLKLKVLDSDLPLSQAQSESLRPSFKERSVFNPLYSFENFIFGRNNELAYKTGWAIAKSPYAQDMLNPLLLYSPSGLGKTHLLNAIGQENLKRFPQKKVLYLSAERFLNEYINALQNKKMEFFRRKFRKNCDLLLIDDIQILARGKGVQEEFFHTFNELYNKKIPVVICCDQNPDSIPHLQERIKTRLSGGLTVDITYPDLETRLAILKKKLDQKNLCLSEKSLGLISHACKRSVREMEGVLNKIKIMTEMQGGRLSLGEIEKILKNIKKNLSVEEIKAKVIIPFNITNEELHSSSRKKQIVRARQVAMFLIKKYLKKSLKDISLAFGKKDHTTTLNAIKKVESLRNNDLEFKRILEVLQKDIHNEY